MIRVALLLLLLAVHGVHGADMPSKEDMDGMLVKWKKAWNTSDVAELMKLCQPGTKLRKGFDGTEEQKQKFLTGFKEVMDVFGTADEATLGKYIEDKQRYVVKIKYSKKGLVPGTMSLIKDKDGQWLVKDFNIDGQGEPELKQ